MNPCQVDWQKLVFPVKIDSVEEKLSSLMKIKQNEKSTFIYEAGVCQESIFLLWQWEKLEKKMVDYRNHLRFTIKCLKNEVIPVSMRLKTNVKTHRGIQIIRMAEKQLLNEQIRSINNILELLMLKRDTCSNKLKNYY